MWDGIEDRDTNAAIIHLRDGHCVVTTIVYTWIIILLPSTVFYRISKNDVMFIFYNSCIKCSLMIIQKFKWWLLPFFFFFIAGFRLIYWPVTLIDSTSISWLTNNKSKLYSIIIVILCWSEIFVLFIILTIQTISDLNRGLIENFNCCLASVSISLWLCVLASMT